MSSNADYAVRRPSAASRWLAKALPFEYAWIRYLLCSWLIVGSIAAAWAMLVAKPATRDLTLRSGYLLDLERDLAAAIEQRDTFDLEALRVRTEEARKSVYPNAGDLDLKIVELLESLKPSGWNVLVAAVERDDTSNPRLAFASYQVELKKVANRNAEQATTKSAPTPASEILAFLQNVASQRGQIDINRFEIITDASGLPQVFLTLSAAIAK